MQCLKLAVMELIFSVLGTVTSQIGFRNARCQLGELAGETKLVIGRIVSTHPTSESGVLDLPIALFSSGSHTMWPTSSTLIGASRARDTHEAFRVLSIASNAN